MKKLLKDRFLLGLFFFFIVTLFVILFIFYIFRNSFIRVDEHSDLSVSTNIRRVQNRLSVVPSIDIPERINFIKIFQGWDPGFKKSCIKTLEQSNFNYFEIVEDCIQNSKNWTLAVQLKNNVGSSCISNDSSFSINMSGSPMKFHIDKIGNDNVGNMTIDYLSLPVNIGNCDLPMRTWFVFMDNENHNGGPYNAMINEDLFTSVDIFYTDVVNNGASRVFLKYMASLNNKTLYIEIDLTNTNWIDNYPEDYKLINVVKNQQYDFFHLFGPAYGINYVKDREMNVNVNWKNIVMDLINRNLILPPNNNFYSSTDVFVIGIGIETDVRNNINSVLANLKFKNIYTYRIQNRMDSIIPTPVVNL